MPELIIFDCDGVLVDSERVTNQVLADNLARYGLVLDLDGCMDRFVGSTMIAVMEKARSLGANLPAAWIDEIYQEMHARLEQGVAPVAGIYALLDRLDADGIRYCVASNGSEEKMRITLGQNRLWDRFERAMFSAHTLGVAKPYPGLFLAAARHFGTDTADCVVIEDSTSGVTAARRAGMRCLGYAPHGDGAALRALGAEVFTDMGDVSHLLTAAPANQLHSA